jgi:hypothetical protein
MVPMGKNAFGGKLVYSSTAELDNKSSLSAPDLGWLRFLQGVSAVTSYGSTSTNRFWVTQYITNYADHRSKLEKAGTISVKRG